MYKELFKDQYNKIIPVTKPFTNENEMWNKIKNESKEEKMDNGNQKSTKKRPFEKYLGTPERKVAVKVDTNINTNKDSGLETVPKKRKYQKRKENSERNCVEGKHECKEAVNSMFVESNQCDTSKSTDQPLKRKYRKRLEADNCATITKRKYKKQSK